MKVIAGADTIDLGTTETGPTIGIIDYSRRVTDDFGVTTVVERGFARRMSVRFALPTSTADTVQRRLADLRAMSALWVADERFASLSFTGFYKDFEVDLGVPPLSYCTLTVEGLAEADPVADTDGDPAPDGQISSLQLLRPVTIGDSALISASVPEADYAAWSSGATYGFGVRVIKAATHRIYESLVAGNVGHDPASDSTRWLDVGPTNRWAMFDQALGTTTTATGSIVVTLSAGAVNAVALLDVVGATVRVQAAGYDRTISVTGGAIPFLDLPSVSGNVTITIAGSGTVSVGTLLIGTRIALGITEASPTASITDFSRKVVDDFGEVTVVQRAWAKRMTARALIRTDAVDVVADRIAAVRARPSLWIGQSGLDSLTVYGFFKDFSIEVGESVSKLSLSIEGLSTAAKVEPLGSGPVNWTDVIDNDPARPKPENGADVTGNHTALDTAHIGGELTAIVKGRIADTQDRIAAVEFAIENTDLGDSGAIEAARLAAEAAAEDAAEHAEIATNAAGDATTAASTATGKAELATEAAGAAATSATLSASYGRTRGNLVVNGSGEFGMGGLVGELTGWFVQRGVWGPVFVNQTANGSGAIRWPEAPAEPGEPYTGTSDTLFAATGGATYVDLVWHLADGSFSDTEQHPRTPSFNFSPGPEGRNANAITAVAPPNAVGVIARFAWEGVTGIEIMGVREMKVERGEGWTAYNQSNANIYDELLSKASVSQLNTVSADQNAARASLQTSINARFAGTVTTPLKTLVDSKASINYVDTAVAGEAGARTTLASNIAAQFAGTSGSGLLTAINTKAGIGQLSDAISTEQLARALVRTDLQAQLDGSVGSGLLTQIGARATTSFVNTALATRDEAIAQVSSDLSSTYGPLSATVSTQAATLAAIDGRTQAYLTLGATADTSVAKMTIGAVGGLGGFSLIELDADIIRLNATYVIIAGTVVPDNLAYGTGGQSSVWYNENVANWNRSDAWGSYAQMQLESGQGQPIKGTISFRAVSTTGTPTLASFRVRRHDGTIVKGGSAANGITYTIPSGGCSIALDFLDNVPQGLSATWYFDVIKVADTNNVAIESCFGLIEELSRQAWQHATINTASGAGPGAGADGGGNINGEGGGFGEPGYRDF